MWERADLEWWVGAGAADNTCRITHAALLPAVGRLLQAREDAPGPSESGPEVEQGGASKDVPEGDVYRLLGGLRLS